MRYGILAALAMLAFQAYAGLAVSRLASDYDARQFRVMSDLVSGNYRQ